MADLDSLLQVNDSHQLRERVSQLVSEVLSRAEDPSANQLSYEQRLELISALPRLSEQQIHDAGQTDSFCPICYTPFPALLAEEETALAIDSPAHPADELGVTKLGQSWQCGHFFCRKDISKWIHGGHGSCPMCGTMKTLSALLAQIESFMQQVHSSGAVAYVDHDGEFRGFGEPLYVPEGGYNDDDRIPNYIYPTLFTALGGFLWGFDTGSVGPITVMPQFAKQFGSISATVQGLFVSSIIATAAFSSLSSGALSDRISRTYTIALGSLIFSVGAAIACSANTLAQLFVGRCVTGLGQGIFISSITVYVMEISPTTMRGRTMTTVQLFNTVGIAAGYFTCFGTVKKSGSISWRLLLGLQALVAIVLAIGTPFFPHSPHWLLSVGRVTDAERATLKLGLRLTEIRKEDELAAAEAAKLTVWQQARELWARDVRFRTFFALFLMSMQQASGIDAVLYYAPVLFQQAGLSTTEAAFLASGVSGILMVALTAGSPRQMGPPNPNGGRRTTGGKRTLIALIYIFIAAFVTSWAVVIRVVSSEMQPKRTRAPASSLAQCLSWAVNWIIAFSTPLFLSRSTSGPYFLFGGFSLLTVLVCLIWQPETKGLSLEALDQGFDDTKLQFAIKKLFKSKTKSQATFALGHTGN
ncbi:MFS sugar [Mycena indigotica]|uniref:MFS sugar n=1 Tax=Mycena indigotica TaxID=2126181 RepID=A0A8H6SM94_9AGAR|nr:MFS sugar [Mycena indigotica]KAF7301628.1 MFS sugar [Mycena indigotica]